jgi:DNA helicase-2/ATP-dependent DNA helicase PcrA
VGPPDHSEFAFGTPSVHRDTESPIVAPLNDAQREAVLHVNGPLLVLAGAGSGKTRVIAHRIAYLILERGVQPDRLVAVTFTNKASAEMRERVESLLGPQGFGSWIGTFHALCLRMLRRDGERIGLEPGFNVYDTDDQLALVKRILRDRAEEEGTRSPRALLSRISRAKNRLERPGDVEKKAFSPQQRQLLEIYREYQRLLHQANAVDFDDLLLRSLDLLRENDDIADSYSSRCEHLLVDEYQDTNRPQYLLIRELSRTHDNVCVVGDEDQSIYRFRGAEIRNILDFEHDHPGTRTIRLERNYRSTATIIDAAGAVIARNVQRKGKTLWTENPRGEPIELFRAPDDRLEAVWIGQRIRALESDYPLEQMAVLYRTNAQSRQFEEVFRAERLPHQIVGSVRFYERKEIKDLLAYLRLAVNPADDVAFRRVVNTPPRGVGSTTLQKVDKVARARELSLLDAAERTLEDGLLSSRPSAGLRGFLDLLTELTRRVADDEVMGLVEYIVKEVDFENYLHKVFPGQGRDRMDNVRALVSATVEYIEEGEQSSLRGFLDRLALVADADDVGARPGVTLMTIHCAKGLEYPVVFLAGLEENLFPHAMSTQDPQDLEEERRLCYVAMTRAKERLVLSHSRYRRTQGVQLVARPSRFLDEVPPALMHESAERLDDYVGEEQSSSTSAFGGGSSAARVASRVRPRPTVATRPAAGAAGADPGDGYAVGAYVLHPRFGAGRIVDREGRGKNLKLTIHFADYGPKRIAPSYTKLQVQVD